MLLVPVRQYCLPKFFKGAHLQDLDAAEYEEAPAIPFNMSFGVSSLKPAFILAGHNRNIKYGSNLIFRNV